MFEIESPLDIKALQTIDFLHKSKGPKDQLTRQYMNAGSRDRRKFVPLNLTAFVAMNPNQFQGLVF